MNYEGIIISSDSVNIDDVVSLLMKRNTLFGNINGFCSENIQDDFNEMISKKERFGINKTQLIEKINKNCFNYYKKQIILLFYFNFCYIIIIIV